jgi:GMP synthase-like glutamine amidotransferase
MRIHCLQHVPFEGPAGIADWAEARGHELSVTRLYTGAAPPSPDAFDWLVVMGGPMGVHDEAEHPWLGAEKALLREAIASGKTIIGVCLGAQLLAEALGARVYRNAEKEIGWLPIELTGEGRASSLFGFLPGHIEVFHWHGDTFDAPPGAVHLARSQGCANQAFLWGERVLGLQFHVETTPESLRALVEHGADDIVPGPYVQSAERMLAASREDFERINGALFGVLDRLAR